MEKALKQMKLEQLAASTGAVSVSKRRRKRQKRIVTEMLSEYASNSTLHGLRYVGAGGLTPCERLFWSATFLASVALCGYLINNVYIKWRTSPVIISVSERMVSVHSVPFPSVTICPQVKSKASEYNVSAERYNIKETLQKNQSLDPKTVETYEDIRLLCGADIMEDFELIDELKTNRNYTNASIVDTFKRVSPRSDNFDVILECMFNNSSCTDSFKRVLTSEGVCFNINGVAADELFREGVQSDYRYTESEERSRGWSPARGYGPRGARGPRGGVYPRRGGEGGARPTLEVSLFTDAREADVLCNGLHSGFRIYLSHPGDLPQAALYYYAAIDGQLSSLAVSVHVLNTAPALRSYAPDERQCYFPEDRQLRYFKIYTLNNCRAECLSNYTYRMCGCIGYYMPHARSDRICTANRLNCMQSAKDQMAMEELRLEPEGEGEGESGGGGEGESGDEGEDGGEGGGCRCLPACFSVEYDAEILKTDFRMSDLYKSVWKEYNESFDAGRYRFSKVDVYFKRPQFVSMRRSELFGVTDFIANIGGLLGVFLGFSFLSLIEIVYFCTLRIGVLLKRDFKNEKENMKLS